MNEIMNSFKHNLPAKILSVLAAAVLWVLVMNEQNPAINSSYTVPVIVTNQPDNVKVTLRTGEVQLKVRAQRSMIAMYNAEDFKAYVDLSSCEMGDNTMKVYTVLPSGCELLELSDETILVNVDPLINKYIPIRTIVTGKVADGMVAAELQPAENQVSVYGPKSHVDKIVNVNAHVKLNDETSDFRTYAITTPVDADGNEIKNVTIEPKDLEYKVKVVAGPVVKTVDVSTAVTGDLSSGYEISSIEAYPKSVEISGDDKLLEKIGSVSAEAVSLAGATSDIIQVVPLVLPDGITSKTSKIRVTIRIIRNN